MEWPYSLSILIAIFEYLTGVHGEAVVSLSGYSLAIPAIARGLRSRNLSADNDVAAKNVGEDCRYVLASIHADGNHTISE